MDASRGQTKPGTLRDHALFVSFFPQLIAGPIVRHAQIAPQYADAEKRRDVISDNLAIGLSIFTIGLAKKVLLADNIQPYASPFDLAARGEEVGFIAAWTGAMAYSLQIFFDFLRLFRHGHRFGAHVRLSLADQFQRALSRHQRR